MKFATKGSPGPLSKSSTNEDSEHEKIKFISVYIRWDALSVQLARPVPSKPYQVKMLCPPLNGPGAGVWGSRQERTHTGLTWKVVEVDAEVLSVLRDAPGRRSFWTATQATSRTTELHTLNLVMSPPLEVLACSVCPKNKKWIIMCCQGRTPK